MSNEKNFQYVRIVPLSRAALSLCSSNSLFKSGVVQSCLSLSAKTIASGPDGHGGYLSLNGDQMSLFYRKFFNHSDTASRI